MLKISSNTLLPDTLQNAEQQLISIVGENGEKEPFQQGNGE